MSLSGGKARPKDVFRSNVEKQLVPESIDGSLAKKVHLGARTVSHQGGRKSSGDVSVSFTDFMEGKP